ncbi:hypothetical protein Hanom_Chr12g01109411 [Helianthus anomalus]
MNPRAPTKPHLYSGAIRLDRHDPRIVHSHHRTLNSSSHKNLCSTVMCDT